MLLVLMVMLLAGSLQLFAAGQQQGGAAVTASSADPFAKYPSTVTLTTMKSLSPGNGRPGDDASNNNYYKLYKDALNIQVNNLWVVTPDQYVTKLNLAIASGDIADTFKAPPLQFQQLVDAGLIMDVTDLYNKYGWETMKSLALPGSLEASKVNGKMMAVPANFLYSTPQATARKDWMDKLGLKIPNTMADLVDMQKKFIAADLDKKGTVGFIGPLQNTFNGLGALFNAYGAYTGFWLKDASGKQMYGSIQPEVKTALQAIHDLYVAGLIDKDFMSQDWGKTIELITSGKAGVLISGQWIHASLSALIKNFPDADMQPFPIPSVQGGPAKVQVANPLSDFIVISKKCKNPEAVIKLLNLNTRKSVYPETLADFSTYNSEFIGGAYYYHRPFMVDELGNPAEHYDLGKGMVDWFAGKRKPGPADVQWQNFINEVQKYEAGDKVDWWGENANWGRNGSISVTYTQITDNKWMIYDAFNYLVTPTYKTKWSTLKDKETEVFSKIVVGDLPISAFDQFVADWKSLGGDQITAEFNARK